MATKKRGLGRGLDALLGSSNAARTGAAGSRAEPGVAQQHPPAGTDTITGEGLRELPVDLIQRGKYQPRQDMHTESLQDLADSISAQGVVQPIVVRPIGREGNQTRYEIIAGERRWRAAQLAGLQEIPAVIRDVPDQAAIAMALIENIQRENLNPMEEARALQRLLQEFELTHQQTAESVGRSRTSVTNLLRLLELNEDVKQLVETGKLEMGHARALLAATGTTQSELARTVTSRGLSVRETERLVKRQQGESASGGKASSAPATDPDTRRLEQDLGERLGAEVKLQAGKGGRGKLVISYNSLDELDGILNHIK